MNEIMIHVQFVDEQTGQIVAETYAPLSTLPQSFEAETHLELGGQHWDVVAADPVTADLFARSGTLALTLRRVHVTQRDATDILYSLPTICDVIPPIAQGTTKLHKRVFELHEDEWRQIEFIPSSFNAEIQEEMKAIRYIYETATVGPGFRALHLRQRIPTPLSLPMPLVLSAFPDPQLYDGIAYERIAGLIDAGFGFDSARTILFGEQRHAFVTTLCLARSHAMNHEEAWTERVKAWMTHHELLLVDWCRCMAYDAQSLDRFWARS